MPDTAGGCGCCAPVADAGGCIYSRSGRGFGAGNVQESAIDIAGSMSLMRIALFAALLTGSTFGSSDFRILNPPQGVIDSVSPIGISGDGQRVVANIGLQPAIWSVAGGIVAIGQANGTVVNTRAAAISNDGVTVVGSSQNPDGLSYSGWRWRSDVGFRLIPSTNGISASILPIAVSSNGTVIFGNANTAWRWTAATGTVPLPLLNGQSLHVNATDLSGSAATGNQFRWDQSGTTVNLTPGCSSVGYCFANGNNTVFGTKRCPSDPNDRCFVNRGGQESFPTSPSFNSLELFACSVDGTFAIGTGMGVQGLDGAIMVPNRGVLRLRDFLTCRGVALPVGSRQVVAHAISNDARYLAGDLINAAGRFEGWWADLGPQVDCTADFNFDCSVDLFDYLDFVDVFAGGSALADFNRDGIVDFFDYLDFVLAFSIAC